MLNLNPFAPLYVIREWDDRYLGSNTTMKKIEATPANTMTLALYLAQRAIKAEWRGQGIRVEHVEPAKLRQAAGVYLAEHPELVAEARDRLTRV